MFKICLATIGVAFFSAATSVAALFYFEGGENVDTTLKFLLIIGLIIVAIVLVVFLCTNADAGNWFWSGAIGTVASVLGTLFLGVCMHGLCDAIDPRNKKLRNTIDIFLWIVGIVAAIYFTILFHQVIDFS